MPVLRATLLKLVSEKKTAFQNIKATALNKKTTVQYYASTLHIVKEDTPRIAEDTNPLQAYYLDFLAKGLTEAKSKEVFQKWQDLIQAALPDYANEVGSQYPDLESRDFINPARTIKFTLYRNGTGSACQISISIINSNVAELIAAVEARPESAGVAVHPDAETSAIDQEAFSKMLKLVLSASKTSFSTIKGAEVTGTTLTTHKSTVELPGAERCVIANGSIAIFFVAYYPAGTETAAATQLMALQKLIGQSRLNGFIASGPEKNNNGSTITYRNDAAIQTIELIKYSEGPSSHRVRVQIKRGVW